MIQLKVRTEYSFRRAYGPLDKVLAATSEAVGIADNNTWGHVPFYHAARKAGIKPILGVELAIVDKATELSRQTFSMMTLIARTSAGLRQLYEFMEIAGNKEHFYYIPRADYTMLPDVGSDVLILTGGNPDIKSLRRLKPERFCIEANPSYKNWSQNTAPTVAKELKVPLVVTSDVYYPRPEDKATYEIIAERVERRTGILHIATEWELRSEMPLLPDEAFTNTHLIAGECNVELPKATMVHPALGKTLEQLCAEGARKLKIDLKNKVYAERLARELAMIHEKSFEDYFFVLADLVGKSRGRMLVGPSRGSSAGSLVCYLTGITTIDPIVHNLMFERFIDVTRADLPDVDVDFPDKKRDEVYDYLRETYGAENVARLGTISRYKPKSALTDVSKKLAIPAWEIKDLKDAIIERKSGDARAAFCIEDTFTSLEIGKATLTKYPLLRAAAAIENHARHSGVHAAGVAVLGSPVTNFCSINREGVAQIDKHDAESLNILKIDCLGLRTLSVIEDCLEQIGMSRDQLLKVPLDDKAAFQILTEGKFAGIFQFEGYALQALTRQMGVETFNDLVFITTLARPGPLHSGGAATFVSRRTGDEPVDYLHPLLKPITGETFGVIIYQEQVMAVGREIGDLSWEDVSSLRKAMSKSLGDEFFDKYWEKFRKGAKAKHKMNEETAKRIWDNMCTFGCLSGDTIIQLPGANQHSPKSITIRDLYNNGGLAKIAEDVSNRAAQRDRKAKIWSIQPTEPPTINLERLVNVVDSGVKETWLVETSDGHKLRATKRHQFYTSKGWRALSDIREGDTIACLGPKVKGHRFKGTGSGAHNKRHGQSLLFLERVSILKKRYKLCQACKNAPYQETHHKDKNRLNNDWNNLLPCCRKCHKKAHIALGDKAPAPHQRGRQVGWTTIVSISKPKMEHTYDIEMGNQSHSFVANGLVVHNSWAFNKSHAVGYSMISYWTAWLKAHHPLEYAAACLRNSRGDEQTVAILRELVEEGFEYKPFDPELSELTWAVRKGKLLGGLTGVKGIGLTTAKDILVRRSLNQPLTNRQQKLLANPVTAYDDVFEGKTKYGDYYKHPEKYGIKSRKPSYIRDIQEPGEYVFLGRMVEKNLRDLNEYNTKIKRGGKEIKNNNLFLNLIFEDDTGSIIATVSRFNYKRLGLPIVETGKIGDWYVIRGEIKDKWRKIYIDRVRHLTKRGAVEEPAQREMEAS